MSQIHSRLDTASPEFVANKTAMQALVEDLNARLAEIVQGGGAANNARIRPVASCCPANASTSCLTRDPRFSNSRRWLPGRSMTNLYPPPAS